MQKTDLRQIAEQVNARWVQRIARERGIVRAIAPMELAPIVDRDGNVRDVVVLNDVPVDDLAWYTPDLAPSVVAYVVGNLRRMK